MDSPVKLSVLLDVVHFAHSSFCKCENNDYWDFWKF